MKEKDENNEEKEKTIPMLKFYNVFHISQCDGINSKYEKSFETDTSDDDESEDLISDYIDREGISFREYHNDNAYYNSISDEIVVPEVTQFETSEEYFSTVFHLMTKSTSHKSRLDREFKPGDEIKEELVDELGAAMLCNMMGIESSKTVKNSAAYISKWMQAISSDSNLILSAAGKAEKAVNYIMGLDVA